MKRIEEIKRPLRGDLTVPGDKSIGHRAVIFASVAEGKSRIFNLSGGDDNTRTIRAFKDLGVEIEEEGKKLVIDGRGWRGLHSAAGVIDCGNSGTTMRLLSGVLAGCPFASTLDGDASLRRRPMKRIIDPLNQMGAEILSRNGRGTAPLTIHGGGLRGIHYSVPVPSAQVKSAVLLAGLQAEGKTVVEEPQRSRNHTEIMIRAFSGEIRTESKAVIVRGPQRLTATDVHVPGDISSAAFYLVGAAAITGSDLLIRGVGCNPTRSGVIDVLKRMGASVELLRQRAARTIDEYPVLSVAAALAEGVTTISGAEELRHKESDRISVMTKALKKLGVQVEEREDGMRIEGRQKLKGARLETHGDHRIAMALAIAALCSEGGVEIDDSACVDISFPGFFELLERVCTP
jgi:3-phosphoshikimate 1-carboxyvinyltransferase